MIIVNWGQAILWIVRALWAFLRLQPLVTISLILCIVGANITQLITMFLPFKVIVLASSDGIPRYLDSLISPDQRIVLIGGLFLVIIFFFMIHLMLESASRALSNSGAIKILNKANKMALDSQEGAQAIRYYNQFCDLAAELTFLAAMLLVILIINPVLFLGMLMVFALEILLTAGLFDYGNPLRPTSIAHWVQKNLTDYLETLIYIGFLIGFLIILIPFLHGSYVDVLLAILSVLLLRRSFTSQKKSIRSIVKLVEQRHQIDPLVFRNRQLTGPPETSHARAFREAFSRGERDIMVASALGISATPSDSVRTEWEDPVTPGVYDFRVIKNVNKNHSEEFFQLKVFTSRTFHHMEHEALLFGYVDRPILSAPGIVLYVDEGFIRYQILDGGKGTHPTNTAWSEDLAGLIARIWSFRPSNRLVKAYLTSRAMLYGRLTDNLLLTMSVAIDTDEEREVMNKLRNLLPNLCKYLEQLPLAIHNPNLNSANCLVRSDNSVAIMTWSNWSIEPIGYGLPPSINDTKLSEILHQVYPNRPGQERALTVQDIRLVQAVQSLEQTLRREAFKQSLTTAKKIMQLIDK